MQAWQVRSAFAIFHRRLAFTDSQTRRLLSTLTLVFLHDDTAGLCTPHVGRADACTWQDCCTEGVAALVLILATSIALRNLGSNHCAFALRNMRDRPRSFSNSTFAA